MLLLKAVIRSLRGRSYPPIACDINLDHYLASWCFTRHHWDHCGSHNATIDPWFATMRHVSGYKGKEGFEPSTPRFGDACSSPLSYKPLTP